ncbi:hypothetical protein Pst134EB_005898 [Puccinia striiformis f. sp. tritici]|nr:hypothetical protein Pst134EB_005898 [Puccinia striiformis f. sp. tritici]
MTASPPASEELDHSPASATATRLLRPRSYSFGERSNHEPTRGLHLPRPAQVHRLVQLKPLSARDRIKLLIVVALWVGNSSSSTLKTTSNHHTRKHSGPTSPVQATYTLLDHDHDGGDLNRSEVCVTRAFSIPESRLTTSETAHLASTFVLLWFAANWSVNAALGYTTVSSTTILSSMSGFLH